MKKIISITVSFILVFVLAVSVSAEANLLKSKFSYMPDVDYKSCSMIDNQYYKIYYNDIFENEYNSSTSYDFDGYTEYFLSLIGEDNYTYATVILNDKTDDELSYAEYNKQILSEVVDGEDLIYIGDTTPVSVVKITKETGEKLKADGNVICVFPAFYNPKSVSNMIFGGSIMGDVTGDSKVTASDARYVLRFSAGLETVEKKNAKMFYFSADMNFDGKVNSSDARLVLRTAAGLEKQSTISFPSVADWYDF